MASARDMEGFVPLLSTTDTKQKLSVGQELLTYLQDGLPIECSDIGIVIDTLVPWIHSSNFKVSQMGLDIMSALAVRMGSYFKPYIPSVLPPVIDRLGDSKELVRERCQLLLSKLLEGGALSPQQLFERLGPAFSHKNGNVREEVLHCLVNTLNQHGAGSISISKLMPSIVKLLSDPNVQVRDATLSTLADIYRHVGDRLRNDIVKKNQVPPSKLPALLAKFDEIKAAGDLLPTALNTNSNFDEDETDRVMTTSVKRSNSAVSRKNVVSALKLAAPLTPSQAGAVDEQTFLQSFEDAPQVQIFGARDLEEQLNNITKIILNQNNEWNKRADALKKIRSLLVSGAANYDEFYNHLRLFDPPFQTSLKDLRSQVVREVCFTVAFMSQQLGNKLEHFVESLLPLLFNLIQNSAKVIATSAQVCVGFIVTHTHSQRLVPLLCAPMSHKSRDIRRAATKFLHLILSNWSNHYLAKHAQLLKQNLQQAIPDADQEVRMFARKAYWAFKNQFPELAEQLLNSLDATYKKSLHSDMSNSSSSNSLNQVAQSRPRAAETPVRRIATASVTSTPRTGSPRSNSAIDLQAAQRAKARAQYAALARQKVGSNTSLPRPRKPSESGPSSLVGVTPGERSRQRTRHPTGVSHSQPSSRSCSPSQRLNYTPYGLDRTRRSPSYSRSTTGSRESSPSRFSPLPPLSKLRVRTDRSQIPSSRPPVMAQKMLQQSIEAENSLVDEPDSHYDRSNFSPTRRLRDDHSDDSETSSICSERSFESYRRQSDSYSWSGSQQKLFRELWEPNLKDINEIMMAIESTHWSDRKDGLISLSNYLQNSNELTGQQLTRLTDLFTKMLSDSHTKVFSLFLDTVNDLIRTHSADLHPWLYILLTRLFNKLGSDLLGSIQSKIHKTLHVVRENFGSEAMLQWALRFLVDSTQTPNVKVKLNVLQFIAKLAPTADPTNSFPPPTPTKGNKDITTAALNKMIGWTMGDSIKQGSELRRAAQEAIVALFNLNTPQITLRFSQLPKEYQEAAASLIEGRVRKASTSGGRDSPRHQDSLSPDQVYHSLRRTTAEIQNYTFDGKVEATSHDSGISQMSVNDRNDLDLMTSWTGSLSLGSPTKTSVNGSLHSETAPNTILHGLSMEGLEEGEKLVKLMDAIEGRTPHYKSALSQLTNTVKNCDAELLALHFKRLLRMFQYEITSGEVEGKAKSLIALGEMMKKPLLHEKFESFVELILLRVIQAYGDSNKEVVKQAEICACTIATLLQMNLVLTVLTPLISTQNFPLNLAAIKIVTKMVETKTQDEMVPFLPDLMPGLVQAYGNNESLVRKASVFCMVALHQLVGAEAIRPYLASLNAAKLKLLHLYISRSQANETT